MLKYASASLIRVPVLPLNISSVYSTASTVSGKGKKVPAVVVWVWLLREPLLKRMVEKSGPIHQDRGKGLPFTVHCPLLHGYPHWPKTAQIRHLPPQQAVRWPYLRRALHALPGRLSKANASMYSSPRVT